jgi:hypothetical protein
MVDEQLVMSDEGKLQKVGEYIRGLATLEAQERDRCAKFAGLAIQAGLGERMVRLAEKQTEIAEKAIMAALADLGLSGPQQMQAAGRVAHHLRVLEASVA